MTNTEISYLVIDNDPNSPECETVYEVLGTMLDGPTGLGTHVYLRSLVTDTVSRMWASEFQAYDFRALPLDQVSQDRKDARDFDAAPKITDDRTGEIWAVAGTAYGKNGVTAIGVWVIDGIGSEFVLMPMGELLHRTAVHAYPRTPEPLQPAPVAEFAAGDLLRNPATGSMFRVVEWTHAVSLRNVVTDVRSAIPADMARELDRIDPDAEHRHEVAEHCGIADSELPATLPVSADRLLGRALYFVRELLDEVTDLRKVDGRGPVDSPATARARAFLAELDAS